MPLSDRSRALLDFVRSTGPEGGSEQGGNEQGSSEQNGTWQVFFVKGNEVVSTVNLDARDATILLVEPDEEGTG